jgi:hypothetical protein
MLRKLLILVILLLSALPAFSQTANVTGHMLFPSGGAATNANVCMTLQNYKPNLPRVTGTGTIVRQTEFCIAPAADGSFSFSLVRNDLLSPTGTFWRIDFLIGGIQQSSANYLINHTPFNLDTETPLNVTPVIGPNQIITSCFTFLQSSPATTWAVNHNENDLNVFVTTTDLNGNVIFPDHVTITDVNNVSITWVAAQSGRALVCHGGSISIATNQPNAIISNATSPQTGIQSLTWNGALNINSFNTTNNVGDFTGSTHNYMGSILNNCSPSGDGQQQPALETLYGCVTIPSGATASHQIDAVSGFVDSTCNSSSRTTCNGVGGYFSGVARGTSGSAVWGINPIVQDEIGGSNANLTAGEFDIVPIGSPAYVTGLNVVLAGNGTMPNLGSQAALGVTDGFGGSTAKWGVVYNFNTGVAATNTTTQFPGVGVWQSRIWNGSASVPDNFQFSISGGTGANPFMNYIWSHPTGTSGSTTMGPQSPLNFGLFTSAGAAEIFALQNPSSGSSGTLTIPNPITGNLVVDNATQTLTNKTLTSPTISSPTITTPIINGTPTGNGLQGTDTKLLTSGTVSGTAAPLCTDANGGATTSGCVETLITKAAVNASVCSTASTAGATCNTTVTWPSSFADTAYSVSCTGTGTITGAPYIAGASKANGSVVVTISNGQGSQAVVSTYGEIDCIGVHP